MRKLVIAAALLLLVTPAAFAGGYVGASVGQSDTSISGVPAEVDSKDTSWKIMGGYTFMKFVGVEGSYRNLGGIDETVGTTSFATEAKSLDVFGVGILPVGPVDLFAKLGYSRIEYDASLNDPILTQPLSVSGNDNEVAYGAGIAFRIGSKFALRLEYEAFNTEETLSMISAGALFRF
jgi:opacity protein-like surface antigen